MAVTMTVTLPSSNPVSRSSRPAAGRRSSIPRTPGLPVAFALALVCVLVCGVPAAAEPSPAGPQRAPAGPVAVQGGDAGGAGAVERGRAGRRPSGPGPRLDRLAQRTEVIRAIWWNEAEVVESLDLSDEQRAAADGHLVAFLEDAGELDGEDLQRVQEELREALVERRWDDARAAAESLSEVRSRPYRRQVELMIAVLAELTPEQVETLRTERPHLLRRPWVRLGMLGGRGGSPRRAPTGP